MKKIFTVIFAIGVFMALAFSSSHAQTVTMTNSGDTIVNTATEACSLKVVNSYKAVTVHALITKISGTVGGTLTLQGGIDGTTYVTVDTASLTTEGASTFTPTNVASQSKVWIMNGAPYLWYKLSYTGTGTMSATLKGYLLPRKQE
jgi:acid phosphatase class B